MKTLAYTIAFLSISILAGAASGQASRFGIGSGGTTGQPKPAQYNSANINYDQGKTLPDITVASGTAVRYDSRSNEMTMEVAHPDGQGLVPLSIGTETVPIDKTIHTDGVAGPAGTQFTYSMMLESRSYGDAWYLNYNSTDFQSLLASLGNQGFRIESIDTYGRSVFDYAGTWTQDGLGWAWVLNCTSSTLITTLNNWPNGSTRYRPIHFAVNPNGTQMLYAAVAVADNLGFAWLLNESSSSSFTTWVTNQYNLNRRLVDIQFTRDTNGNLMCSAITTDATYAQQAAINLSAGNFASTNTQYINLGYRLVDVDKYYIGGTLYYAGLWNKDGVGYAYSVDYTSLTTFQSTVTNYISQGFKPIAIDVYDADWATSVAEEKTQPDGFYLQQNYPNPFNPSTTIPYELAARSFVTLRVYDILGEEVAALVNGQQSAGKYDVQWNAANLPSGMYFCRLQAGNQTSVKKIQLLK